eukprot:CAMPEP_0184501342 /NCGR_PEP_ID=MMETSP0113_2-20130426/47417_1 /TAXON_ID=91329 /ORGANISM="Norrisiella sphaerica, Strain BC52" /LENGTH=226 /DNA_ID=CAMNT_0026890075 /DNA_START=942 /DNA_END=1624 /DNA_ORIENTATION=-
MTTEQIRASCATYAPEISCGNPLGGFEGAQAKITWKTREKEAHALSGTTVRVLQKEVQVTGQPKRTPQTPQFCKPLSVQFVPEAILPKRQLPEAHQARLSAQKKNLIVAEAMNPEKIHELLAAEPADAERLSRSPGAETHHVSTGREQGQGVGARSPFGQRQRQILEDWLMEHASDPYPSSLIKIHLSELTKLTVQQLDRWFINARARKMRKAMDGHGAGSAKARS